MSKFGRRKKLGMFFSLSPRCSLTNVDCSMQLVNLCMCRNNREQVVLLTGNIKLILTHLVQWNVDKYLGIL